MTHLWIIVIIVILRVYRHDEWTNEKLGAENRISNFSLWLRQEVYNSEHRDEVFNCEIFITLVMIIEGLRATTARHAWSVGRLFFSQVRWRKYYLKYEMAKNSFWKIWARREFPHANFVQKKVMLRLHHCTNQN